MDERLISVGNWIMGEKKYHTIYAIGVFDLFHRGHIEFLKNARSLGNRLIVAVNSDRLVSEYKRRPIYSEEDRLALISECKLVDECFIIDTYDNKEAIKKYQVDAIVHGDDWPVDSYMKQICVDEAFLTECGAELVLVRYTEGISTSQIISRIKNS